MELTLQDTISGKKNLIGLALPIQMAVYVPSTKDANVPIDEMEVKSRVQEVSKYLAGLFGGFSSEEVVGGYISNNKELIRENVIKVVAYSTKADYEKNKRKLINKISEWAEQWSQEAIGFEFENDLYYINKSKMFKDGGSVDAEKEKEFLSGYNFKDYEDMIQTLKDAKVQKYDIGDSFDNSIDLIRLIKKTTDKAEGIVDEYKYNRRHEDSVLVINVKLHAYMDNDKAIAEATEKYKLNESQVEELESEFNNERVSQIYLDYIEMQRMDIEENFSDFIELNICKDEIFFTGNSGGYLIFQEYDFFDSMTEELTEYEDNNFTSDGEFNADDYTSFEQFIQAEGRNIRKIIGLINYYEFAFSVFEAYVKKLKKGVEGYMQGELNERVEEYVLEEIKPKQKTIKKAAKKKVVEVVEETESKDDSDSYKNGGEVEPYDDEKYASEYDYLRKIITKQFGEKNRNFSSADWGGIDNWTIKGNMYEGIFIIIDDDNKVVLMERKHNEELEEEEDTDILEAETTDTKALQILFEKAMSIKENKKYKDGGIAESVYNQKNKRIDEVLKGGKADSMDEMALAKKHNVSLETIQKQIEKGMAFEKEHTDNVTVQREIAKDHVEEFVDYYDRLKEMEKEAEVRRTILTKNLSANKIHSIKKYLKHKGMSENDYHVYDSGTILIYSDISDTTFKEISIYIKNSLI
jgi:hypothetical protein